MIRGAPPHRDCWKGRGNGHQDTADPSRGLHLVIRSHGVRDRLQVRIGRHQLPSRGPEAIVPGFDRFPNAVKVTRTESVYRIESGDLPDHGMMVGISNWQQQVPTPQPYTGANAWQLPVSPVLAEKPLSCRNAFYRGAIAIAANGVPIFNPMKAPNEDVYLLGELDG